KVLEARIFVKDEARWEAPSIHSTGCQRAGQVLCWKQGRMVGCWGCWSPPLVFSMHTLTPVKATSTLLQPPIVRTGLLPHAAAPASSAHKPPTARDIPPVTLTNIAHVDASEFKPYLVQLGAFYERLRRVEGGEDEAADIFHKRSGQADEFAVVLHDGSLRPGKRPPATRKSSVPSVSSSLPMEVEVPSPIRRWSSEFARRATQGPPPLTTIPAVYFDADFHLENPRTFDVVTERSEVVPPHQGHWMKRFQQTQVQGHHGKPWQPMRYCKKSYLAASTSFFAALGSLRELHAEAADSVERIKALRNELDVLNQEIAISGLHIVQKRQRWGNLQQLQDAILQLKHIVDSVAACESLVDNGDIDKASESIASLEKLISGEPGFSKTPCRIDGQSVQLRDLRGAAALQGAHDDLATLRFRIGKAYETQCLSLLVGDLRRHSEAVSTQEVLIRWTGAFVRPRGVYTQEHPVLPSYLSSTGRLRSELLETLTGLHRAKYLMIAATAYREAALKEIRNLVRRPLPSANDEDNESMVSLSTMTGGTRLSQQQKSSILARNLRALEPGDAEAMLIEIYVSVTETLRRLTTQVKLLLDVTSSLDYNSSIAARQTQELYNAIDLPRLLGEAVDIAQDRIVKLLRVRSEQSTRLSRAWFLRYVSLNLGFVSECESISGRSGTALKTVVNGQIKDFIQQHGEAERQMLTQGMESDQWEARDFSDNDTAKLNWILSCSTTDPAEWSDGLKIWIPCSDGHPESGEAGDPQPPSDGSKARTRRSACIGEQVFVLPSSAILCMNGLSHFLQLISGMPSMAADISTSLVSYLRHFNACCTRLVLDAGARQSAGLKNITSKHLALASQALAFIATLTSHVREFVRRHAGRGATALRVVEFDEVKHLYQEHQNRMHDRLVQIMSRLAGSHVKALKNIDWDDGQKDVHPYMATLAKDTKSLHRILTKTMPKETVRMVMGQAFLSYKVQFGQAFQEIGPMTELGRDSMLLDVEFFKSNLGMMEGFGDAGEYLTAIVKVKHVKIAALDAPSSSAWTAGEDASGDAGPGPETASLDGATEDEKLHCM
ncbi:Vacuolar protein sorting-associated protein 54, partial [Tolypocladium paradoxum]